MKINPAWKFLMLSKNGMNPRGAGGMFFWPDPVEMVRDRTVVVWSRFIGPAELTKKAIKDRL